MLTHSFVLLICLYLSIYSVACIFFLLLTAECTQMERISDGGISDKKSAVNYGRVRQTDGARNCNLFFSFSKTTLNCFSCKFKFLLHTLSFCFKVRTQKQPYTPEFAKLAG
jgi:hypothetical protein